MRKESRPVLTRHGALLSAACIACLAGLQLPAMRAAVATAPSRPVLRSSPGAGAPGGHTPGRSATAQILTDLRAAWQITRGERVTVAVVDSRVIPSVAGLAGKVTVGRTFGYTAGHWDENSTLFAEAVAGDGPSGSNPTGTVGLAPGARILSVPVPDRGRYPTWESNDARAIRYAARHGASVIFVGIIGGDDTLELDRAVRYATVKGAVLVADDFGRGNAPSYPNSLTGVLNAASVMLPGLPVPPVRAASPVNSAVLASAPGNVITVNGPAGREYEVFNALSAAAWLTATLVMIKSVFPHLPPGLVARAIAVSARDRPRGGYNTRIGFGLINPAGALHAAARLAKLHLAARSGTPGAVGPSARLAAGPEPGPIRAVHHSIGRVAGYAGTIAAGAVLLVFAALLARRWRRASNRG